MSNNEDIIHSVVNDLATEKKNPPSKKNTSGPKRRKVNQILKKKHRSKANLIGNMRRLRTKKPRAKKRCSQCYK